MSYDANGNRDSVTPPGQGTHTFTYTDMNQLMTYAPPPGSDTTTYGYDELQRLTSIAFPLGQNMTVDYDPAPADCVGGDRCVKVTHDTNLTSPTSVDVITALKPDTKSPQTIRVPAPVHGPSPIEVSLSYTNSALTGMSWSGTDVNGSVAATWDSSGRVDSMTVDTTTTNYGYNPTGSLKDVGLLNISRYQDGTELPYQFTLSNITETWSAYNGYNEPTAYLAEYTGTPQADLLELGYAYDEFGRIWQKTEAVEGGTAFTYEYTYDERGRLKQVTKDDGSGAVVVEDYDYDTNGNRISYTNSTGTWDDTTTDYDTQDRVTAYGGATYAIDANGYLATKTVGADTTQYTYDTAGNLRRVDLPGGTVVEYIIDGAHRRIGKKVNGTFVKGWLYKDNLNPVAELDGNGDIVSVFVYGTRPNVPDYIVRADGTYRILTDQVGSPRVVVDVDDGTVVARIDYDSFGIILNDTDPNLTYMPFRFAGGLYDKDTKLIRFGARDYDPHLGRWTAREPLLFDGGDTNLFVYAFGDPVSHYDPDGLAGLPIGDGTSCGNSALCMSVTFGGAAAATTTANTVLQSPPICLPIDLPTPTFPTLPEPRFYPLDFVRPLPIHSSPYPGWRSPPKLGFCQLQGTGFEQGERACFYTCQGYNGGQFPVVLHVDPGEPCLDHFPIANL